MYIELVMREEQLLVQELYIKSPAVPARLHPLNLPWTNIKTIVSLINDSQNGKYISSMDSVRVEVLSTQFFFLLLSKHLFSSIFVE